MVGASIPWASRNLLVILAPNYILSWNAAVYDTLRWESESNVIFTIHSNKCANAKFGDLSLGTIGHRGPANATIDFSHFKYSSLDGNLECSIVAGKNWLLLYCYKVLACQKTNGRKKCREKGRRKEGRRRGHVKEGPLLCAMYRIGGTPYSWAQSTISWNRSRHDSQVTLHVTPKASQWRERVTMP